MANISLVLYEFEPSWRWGTLSSSFPWKLGFQKAKPRRLLFSLPCNLSHVCSEWTSMPRPGRGNYNVFLCLFCEFETESQFVSQAGLELPVKPRLTSQSCSDPPVSASKVLGLTGMIMPGASLHLCAHVCICARLHKCAGARGSRRWMLACFL